eukprot:RCo040811
MPPQRSGGRQDVLQPIYVRMQEAQKIKDPLYVKPIQPFLTEKEMTAHACGMYYDYMRNRERRQQELQAKHRKTLPPPKRLEKGALQELVEKLCPRPKTPSILKQLSAATSAEITVSPAEGSFDRSAGSGGFQNTLSSATPLQSFSLKARAGFPEHSQLSSFSPSKTGAGSVRPLPSVGCLLYAAASELDPLLPLPGLRMLQASAFRERLPPGGLPRSEPLDVSLARLGFEDSLGGPSILLTPSAAMCRSARALIATLTQTTRDPLTGEPMPQKLSELTRAHRELVFVPEQVKSKLPAYQPEQDPHLVMFRSGQARFRTELRQRRSEQQRELRRLDRLRDKQIRRMQRLRPYYRPYQSFEDRVAEATFLKIPEQRVLLLMQESDKRKEIEAEMTAGWETILRESPLLPPKKYLTPSFSSAELLLGLSSSSTPQPAAPATAPAR